MADNNRLRMVLPVGRYISGDHANKKTTDFENRPIADESKHQFTFGVAVRKDAPGLNEIFQSIWNMLLAAYAQDRTGVQQRMGLGLGVGTKKGGISWKFRDGDQPDQKGNIDDNARGCWVFYFASSFMGKFCNNQNVEFGPENIKRGYYVDVSFSTAANGEPGDRAGIYLNQEVTRLVGYGEEIHGGISAAAAFGGAAPTYIPPGMSQVPVAPAGGIPQAQQPQGGQYGHPLPGQLPPPQGMPQGAPTGYPQPGFPGAPMGQPPQGMPNGFPPQGGVPNAGGYPGQTPVSAPPAFPSNPPQGAPTGYPPQGMPSGFPMAGSQPPPNGALPTGYPTNPQTGQPVQPYYPPGLQR